MLLGEVKYARAGSVAEALEVLEAHEDARVLAGGQTLVNVMKLRLVSPGRVVDVTRVPELRGVSVGADGWLEIGAATTYAEIVESSAVWAVRPVVGQVAGVIADVQVRNRGTIGGNVCLNLATSHFPPVLVAVGATLTIAGRGGERSVPADGFFQTVFSTAVGRGELLTRVRIPPREVGQGDAFVAVSRGRESMSVVHAAASVRAAARIEQVVVAVGCVGPRPLRPAQVERALVGAEPTAAAVADAVAGLGAGLGAPADVNASSRFRGHLAEVVTRRAVVGAIEQRKGG